MEHIVVVEDDHSIADMLCLHLREQHYQVTHIDDGLKARKFLLNESYDLVLLDIMLPNYNGLDICKELRQVQPIIPILLLTSMSGEADRVIGLELGADDYLTKPFSLRECIARIKALLRRSRYSQAPIKAEEQQEQLYKELSIHISHRQIKLAGTNVDLTAREFDLLAYLAQHGEQVFSRNQLLDSVWGYSHEGYEHTVNTHINRLRNKLKRSDNQPDFIQTVWGVGYKFSLGDS
jgi:DNA-binding response OmpR family regulator